MFTEIICSVDFMLQVLHLSLHPQQSHGTLLIKLGLQFSIPLVVPFKTSVCSRFILESAGSNPAEVADVSLLCLLCVV
jgi:hypothetical protein